MSHFTDLTPPQYRTSVRTEARGMGNVFVAEVIGRTGRGTFYARTFDLAIHTARRYARLFDAPRSVI